MPNKHWSVFVIAVFLVWMGFVGAAFAQGMDDPSGSASATAASSGAGDTGAMSLNMISAVIDRTIGQDLLLKFKDKALSIAAALTPAALVIAGALALATLLWQVLIAMINKESPLTAATEAVLFPW
ncbi:hypothetical protein LP417_33935 (plasmid) [Polaromonas sp. P1-6]|nr:hypothetical protein LP417_33935 [Polaromonas sp. P1-6]